MRLIDIKNASFTYPNGYPAVEDINLQVELGDNIAVIGQNGAGKTTTVKMINGLLKPTTGSVIVKGTDTKSVTTAEISKTVGYVFQNPDDQIFNSNVYDEIAYSLKKSKTDEKEIERRVKKYAKLCGVYEYLNENPYDLPLSIRKLVTIASVISTNVNVVILDEPTAGQDLVGLNVISNIIENLIEEDRAVITITHDMEFVSKNFNQIIVMANKRIQTQGNAFEVFYDDEMMALASLKPPLLVQVAKKLGLEVDRFSPESLAEAVKSK